MSKPAEYPKMLYRHAHHGHAHESAPGADDHVTVEHRTVEDADEEKAAKADGFSDTLAEAAKAAKRGK